MMNPFRLSVRMWRRMHFLWLKRMLPKTLFGRTLLIVVLPTILALTVATFVFFDRHWSTVTQRLVHSVAADIGVVVDILDRSDERPDESLIGRLAEKKMDLILTFYEDMNLNGISDRDINPIRVMLSHAMDERVPYPHHIDMRGGGSYAIIVQVEGKRGVYSFQVPRRRIYTPTTEVFIGWMIGSSILLSIIALLFMRNQVRPVRRLAEAAEAIGKGQLVPWFKAEGALEVRQAAAALMIMRDRIRRAMTQRTTMLAGVSHDLRTPLTRMKLQLAMMPETAQTRGFQSDIRDMEHMLEAYLAFARGEESEPVEHTEIGALVASVVESMRRQYGEIPFAVERDICMPVRPQAIKRCFENLLSNALRYGKQAQVTLTVRDNAVDIIVDDDGTGIPPECYEDVFKPFLRLDASRNMDTGGVGLGLSVARDIARAHGGDIVLAKSPTMGGLRARLWLPA
ncbi:MAG: ATP-binding protein [Alphaproteobacteria bacterium]|jgi:two-component system osmolarity sensor histidine kinase EnvZ|nr:ATP-binding protein [Alphaproteobacteria bacterium]